MSTPNLGLLTAPNGSTNISAAYNDAMQVIDALLHLAVLDKDLTAPPVTVAGDAGKRWIVAAAPTGAWAGQAGNVALCTGATLWRFLVPKEGWEAWVVDEAVKYRYESGAWVVA